MGLGEEVPVVLDRSLAIDGSVGHLPLGAHGVLVGHLGATRAAFRTVVTDADDVVLIGQSVEISVGERIVCLVVTDVRVGNRVRERPVTHRRQVAQGDSLVEADLFVEPEFLKARIPGESPREREALEGQVHFADSVPDLHGAVATAKCEAGQQRGVLERGECSEADRHARIHLQVLVGVDRTQNVQRIGGLRTVSTDHHVAVLVDVQGDRRTVGRERPLGGRAGIAAAKIGVQQKMERTESRLTGAAEVPRVRRGPLTVLWCVGHGPLVAQAVLGRYLHARVPLGAVVTDAENLILVRHAVEVSVSRRADLVIQTNPRVRYRIVERSELHRAPPRNRQPGLETSLRGDGKLRERVDPGQGRIFARPVEGQRNIRTATVAQQGARATLERFRRDHAGQRASLRSVQAGHLESVPDGSDTGAWQQHVVVDRVRHAVGIDPHLDPHRHRPVAEIHGAQFARPVVARRPGQPGADAVREHPCRRGLDHRRLVVDQAPTRHRGDVVPAEIDAKTQLGHRRDRNAPRSEQAALVRDQAGGSGLDRQHDAGHQGHEDQRDE